jgi:ABC-2 type transport system ATP-binding protein
MIEVQDVTKQYGAVRAVSHVTFSAPRGAVVGVLGPNGAGKTTTVRMIAGTVPPTSGRVIVDGLDCVTDSRRVRERLGYLPEANPLYGEMRVVEYLRHRATLHGLRAGARRRAVNDAIERCWLSEMRRRRCGALSKGYRQRVGLAAALLHDPEVLLLDEPTAGLDPAQVRETRSLIRSLAGERTALIVSHALAEVERTCDRLVIFADGRVRAEGDADELVRRHGPGNTWRISARPRGGDEANANATTLIERFERVPGALAVRPVAEYDAHSEGWLECDVRFEDGATDAGERLGAALREAGADLRLLERRRASLEEVYITLVSAERGTEGGGEDEAPPTDATDDADASTPEGAAA